jgi:hypothetical protein
MVDTLVRLHLGTSWMVVRYQVRDAQMELRQPWADSDLLAVSGDGERIAVVRRPVANSDSAAYQVLCFRADGRLEFDVRVEYRPVPLPEPDVEREVTRIVAMAASGFDSEERGRRAVRQALFRPVYFPPVIAVAVASDHRVWVQVAGAGPEQTWHVLDPHGHLWMQVRGAPGVQFKDARGAAVWGTVSAGGRARLTRFRVQPD